MRKLDEALTNLTSGARLSLEDVEVLFTCHDLHVLAGPAREAQQHHSGNKVYLSRNANVNHTNGCTLRCPLCAFSRDPEDPASWFQSIEEIAAELDGLDTDGQKLTEIHVVGGLHPRANLDYFLNLFRTFRERWPDALIQGLTAVEIDELARQENTHVRDILIKLKDAGLGGIPGGGAEIFNPRVRAIVAPQKISGARWLAVHREAHWLDIPTNATMLYGHVETLRERAEHLLALRDLQDETGGFRCFVPLAFHAQNTQFGSIPPTTGRDDLVTYAVSRLALDNIPHLKGLWMYMGLPFAQIALNYGVDDFGGTAHREKIVHAAGARTPDGSDLNSLAALCRQAGRIPVLTDAAYRFEQEIEPGQ